MLAVVKAIPVQVHEGRWNLSLDSESFVKKILTIPKYKSEMPQNIYVFGIPA